MHHLDDDLKLWRRLLEISVRFHVAVHWNGPESVVERLEISSWLSNFIGRSIRIEADDWLIEHEMTGNSIRLYYQLFYGLLMTDDCSRPESSFHFVGILGDLCLFMSRVEEVMSRYISVFNDAICCSFPLPVSIPSKRIHFRKRTSEHFVKYHQRVFRRAIPKIRAVYLRASPRVESTTVVFQWPSGRPRAVTVSFFFFVSPNSIWFHQIEWEINQLKSPPNTAPELLWIRPASVHPPRSGQFDMEMHRNRSGIELDVTIADPTSW